MTMKNINLFATRFLPVMALLVAILAHAGCTTRSNALEILAVDPAWEQTRVDIPLPAAGWVRGRSDTIHIYIEGDGVAYTSRNRPSSDPTPRVPTGLLLALEDDSAAVAYLGRPCQYVSDARCDVVHWTIGRFSEAVVRTANSLVEEVKRLSGAKRIVLYGYSGGGAVAALLAARRTDIDKLVTICGNLDHALWTNIHGVSPLAESLNPTSIAARLEHVPQVHFVGGEDEVVPRTVVDSFVQSLPAGTDCTVRVIDGLGHGGTDWAKRWREIRQANNL